MNKFVDVLKTAYFRGAKTHFRRLLRRQQPKQPSTELLKTLKQRGFAIIDNYLDSNTCDALAADLTSILSRYEAHIWRDETGSDERAFGAEDLSLLIRSFHRDRYLQDLGTTYLGYAIEPFFTMANRVSAAPGNLGSGGGWHRDTAAEAQFKAVVYLVDVDPHTGPLQYVPESHTLRAYIENIWRSNVEFAQYRFTPEQMEPVLARRPAVEMCAHKGCLILFDSSGFHRGAPVVNQTRFSLTNYYFGPEAIRNMRHRGKFSDYFIAPRATTPSGTL